MKKDSLIIYSGGMDSTTLLYEYQNQIGLAISFNYGSKHNDIEFQYAKYNCEKLNIPLIRIDLDFMNYFNSNLLKGQGEIPEGHYTQENMKKTVVPFRNGIMLSIAVGLAESKNLKKVLIANHFGDHAIYPDCRNDFITNFTKASIAGTSENIEINAPYTLLSKRDIALKGKELGVDFAKTYSCYKGGKIHCGRCGTCVERLEALEGFDDTKYQDNNYWKGVCNENK